MLCVETVDDYKNIPLTELSRKFQEGVKNSDPDRMLVWAGTGVGSMNKVQTAKVRPHLISNLHFCPLPAPRYSSKLHVSL